MSQLTIEGHPSTTDMPISPETPQDDGTSTATKLARGAMERLVFWAEQANDGGLVHAWLEKHLPSIESDVTDRIGSFGGDHVEYDLYALQATENLTLIMTAGIKDDIDNAHRHSVIQPPSNIDTVNKDTRTAIAAQVSRLMYLEGIAKKSGDKATIAQVGILAAIFQTNVISDMQRAVSHPAENDKSTPQHAA